MLGRLVNLHFLPDDMQPITAAVKSRLVKTGLPYAYRDSPALRLSPSQKRRRHCWTALANANGRPHRQTRWQPRLV